MLARRDPADTAMTELLVVLFVVLLVFGAGRIPALGDGLGKAIRNFKRSYRGEPAAPARQEPKPPPPLGPGDGGRAP
jgi:sec-independent protein translocase protein TatA